MIGAVENTFAEREKRLIKMEVIEHAWQDVNLLSGELRDSFQISVMFVKNYRDAIHSNFALVERIFGERSMISGNHKKCVVEKRHLRSRLKEFF